MGWLEAAGGIIDTATSMYNARRQRQENRYLANNAVSMRVADAKRAGIHPLAALGISPIGTAGGVVGGDSNLARSGRALDDIGIAKQAKEEKERLYRLEEMEAQARAKNLEADTVYKMALASGAMRQAQNGNSQKDPEAKRIVSRYGDFTTSATTSQQDVEDQYGGIIGEMYGVDRFMNDVAKAVARRMKERADKVQRDYQRNKPRHSGGQQYGASPYAPLR